MKTTQKLLLTAALTSSLVLLSGCQQSTNEAPEIEVPEKATVSPETQKPAAVVTPVENKKEEASNSSDSVTNSGGSAIGWSSLRVFITPDPKKIEPVAITQKNGAMFTQAPKEFTACAINTTSSPMMVSISVQGFNNNLRPAEKTTSLQRLEPNSTRCFSKFNLNQQAPQALAWVGYNVDLKDDSSIKLGDEKETASGVIYFGNEASEKIELWGVEYPQYDPNNISTKMKEQEIKNKIANEKAEIIVTDSAGNAKKTEEKK